MEQQEIESRRRDWNHKDEITERQQIIEKYKTNFILWMDVFLYRLQSELVKVREEGERMLASHTQEKVQLDLQLQSLQTSYEKLKDDLQARVQDIERSV